MAYPGDVTDRVLRAVSAWYERQRQHDGSVNCNVMCVGLILTYHMGRHFPLDQQRYLTSGGQVSGLSGERIKSILADHGEDRGFTTEAGRTSRGTVPLTVELAELLNDVAGDDYRALTEDERDEVRLAVQAWLVDCVRTDFLALQRIEAPLDASLPMARNVTLLLDAARKGGAAETVARHLVGAAAAMRAPAATNTGDDPIIAGTTAIHVTLRPSDGLMSGPVRDDLVAGLRPVVVTLEDRVVAARQLADNAGVGDRVTIHSIEGFVGATIEALAGYDGPAMPDALRDLLETYNARVAAVEPDRSIQIEVPEKL
jgi:hypothetical protein